MTSRSVRLSGSGTDIRARLSERWTTNKQEQQQKKKQFFLMRKTFPQQQSMHWINCQITVQVLHHHVMIITRSSLSPLVGALSLTAKLNTKAASIRVDIVFPLS